MKIEYRWGCLLFFIAIILSACGQPAPQTVLVTEATAVLTPNEELGTPTSLIELVAPSPAPTDIPVEPDAPTPVVEIVPAETAVPAASEPTQIPVSAVLTITDPPDGLTVNTGSSLLVAGQVDPTTAVSVTVQLQMGRYLLVDTVGRVNASTGNWIAEMMIPHTVAGLGRINVATLSETAVQDLQIVHDPAADTSGVSVEMLRPGKAQIAAAGHPLFFEGVVTGAVGNQVTIGVLTDNCTTFAARQTITLTASDAAWNGMVNLPQTLNGRACAFVSTGSPETGFWREVQTWIPTLHPDEETVIGQIILGNPLSQPFAAGTLVHLFGSAIDSAGGELIITWLAGDRETVLASGTAVVDSLGFWETELFLPANAAGETTIMASMGEGNELVVMETAVTVAP
jgi:hypothetical protein